MTMTRQQIVNKARETRLRVGNETKQQMISTIESQQVPLTINEINHLLKDTFGRAISRQHLRIVLKDLADEGVIKSRLESPSEQDLRVSTARGMRALLFGTGKTIEVQRKALPFVTSYKTVYKTKKRPAVAPKVTINELIESMVADRTSKLAKRVAELEARLAKIAKIAN